MDIKYGYGSTYLASGRPKAANAKPLTEEEINQLKSEMTDEELEAMRLRETCTHKHPEGSSPFIPLYLDGETWKCTICGAYFSKNSPFVDLSEDVKKLEEYCKSLGYMNPVFRKGLIFGPANMIPILRKLPEIKINCEE